ncbi:hypothetical protein J6590_006361 [Homalodisca vitripennis]|nr:hypothetical protein J6590_006361 [Homalodisca vitripennis]
MFTVTVRVRQSAPTLAIDNLTVHRALGPAHCSCLHNVVIYDNMVHQTNVWLTIGKQGGFVSREYAGVLGQWVVPVKTPLVTASVSVMPVVHELALQ